MNPLQTPRSRERKTKINFTLERFIEKSNYRVYLAHSSDKTKHYALKAFPCVDSQLDPCYLNECRAMNFSHPNLVPIRDTQSSMKLCSKDGKSQQEVSYILMDYAPYGTLSDYIWLKKLPNDEKLIRTIFHFLVEGVSYMHANDFAHTDLKPENVLMGNDYIPMITDFSTMVEINNFDELACLGTPNFRAPEIVADECVDPVAADIYSLGILLLTMFLGQNPYFENMVVKGMDLQKMLQESNENFWSIYSDAKMPKWESESFKKLVFDMTRKNPVRRTTFRQVVENRWYKGEIYTKDEYKNIMKNCVSEC